MANAEYVRVSDSEKFYGQNNLLKSQLELLKIIRGFGNYKRQRSEELRLKISLRAKISETLEAIKVFDKLLPRTNYKPEIERIKSGKKKVNLSLQEEILEIKEKLRKLQGGM